MKSCGVTIQMKSLWQYFRIVLLVLQDLKKSNLGFFLIFTLATTRSDRVKTEMLASNPGFLVNKLFIFWRNVTCYIWPQGRFPFSQNFRFNRLKCKRGSAGNFPERTDVLGGTSPLFPFQPVGLEITVLFAQNFHFCCSRYKLVTFVP